MFEVSLHDPTDNENLRQMSGMKEINLAISACKIRWLGQVARLVDNRSFCALANDSAKKRKRPLGWVLTRWRKYVRRWQVATLDKRLRIEGLGLVVLDEWLHLSSIESSTLKARAILMSLEVTKK